MVGLGTKQKKKNTLLKLFMKIENARKERRIYPGEISEPNTLWKNSIAFTTNNIRKFQK